MRLISKLDGSCEPLHEYQVDIQKLNASVDLFLEQLFKQANRNFEEFLQNPFGTINLSHLPSVTGTDRFFKYSGNKFALMKNNIEEQDFSVVPKEIESIYLGEVIRQVENYHLQRHGSRFLGRYQLSWVNPMSCFPLHIDKSTPHRYHVALKTNPDCWWIFRDHRKHNDISLLHMPADGRVWYLDPVQQEHSVANLGRTPRCHLLMTSGI